MTLDGVARVERGLEITLPDDLRQLYLEHPFGTNSWAYELAMPNDAEDLLQNTQLRRGRTAPVFKCTWRSQSMPAASFDAVATVLEHRAIR